MVSSMRLKIPLRAPTQHLPVLGVVPNLPWLLVILLLQMVPTLRLTWSFVLKSWKLILRCFWKCWTEVWLTVHTMSTRYHLLVIRCQWRFLATWWSGYPYLLPLCVVFRMYDVIIDVALSHHQSCYTAVTHYVSVVYDVCPSMPKHHITSLFHSTTTSNNLSPKVRVVLLW